MQSTTKEARNLQILIYNDNYKFSLQLCEYYRSQLTNTTSIKANDKFQGIQQLESKTDIEFIAKCRQYDLVSNELGYIDQNLLLLILRVSLQSDPLLREQESKTKKDLLVCFSLIPLTTHYCSQFFKSKNITNGYSGVFVRHEDLKHFDKRLIFPLTQEKIKELTSIFITTELIQTQAQTHSHASISSPDDVPISSPTSAPVSSPDNVPNSSPDSAPVSSPDDVPNVVVVSNSSLHVTAPVVAPDLVPVVAPDLVPVVAPDLVPVVAPTTAPNHSTNNRTIIETSTDMSKDKESQQQLLLPVKFLKELDTNSSYSILHFRQEEYRPYLVCCCQSSSSSSSSSSPSPSPFIISPSGPLLVFLKAALPGSVEGKRLIVKGCVRDKKGKLIRVSAVSDFE